MPGLMSEIIGVGKNGFSNCEFNQCYIEHDRYKNEMKSYHSIVFNMNALHYSGQLPWQDKNFQGR